MPPYFHAQAASCLIYQQTLIYGFWYDPIATHYTTAAVYLNIRITQLTKCIVNNHSYINLKEEMRGIPGKYLNVKVIYLESIGKMCPSGATYLSADC
jgi:hypothetical protein